MFNNIDTVDVEPEICITIVIKLMISTQLQKIVRRDDEQLNECKLN